MVRYEYLKGFVFVVGSRLLLSVSTRLAMETHNAIENMACNNKKEICTESLASHVICVVL